MPVVKPSAPRAGGTGSRFCRRCGSEIRISSVSALGVVCPKCGTTAPTNGLVRGGGVTIRRPSELRAFEIGEPGPTPSRRSSRRASVGARGPHRRAGQPSGWLDADLLVQRAEESFEVARERIRESPRLVLSIAAVVVAGGVAVLIVTVLS